MLDIQLILIHDYNVLLLHSFQVSYFRRNHHYTKYHQSSCGRDHATIVNFLSNPLRTLLLILYLQDYFVTEHISIPLHESNQQFDQHDWRHKCSNYEVISSTSRVLSDYQSTKLLFLLEFSVMLLFLEQDLTIKQLHLARDVELLLF